MPGGSRELWTAHRTANTNVCLRKVGLVLQKLDMQPNRIHFPAHFNISMVPPDPGIKIKIKPLSFKEVIWESHCWEDDFVTGLSLWAL